MLMMRALWSLPRPTQKKWEFLASRHRAGCGRPSAHDARRLVFLGSSTAAPKPAIVWGMAAKRVHVPRSLRARSRAAQWKKEGPMKQGRRHYASWLFASHLATGLGLGHAEISVRRPPLPGIPPPGHGQVQICRIPVPAGTSPTWWLQTQQLSRGSRPKHTRSL